MRVTIIVARFGVNFAGGSEREALEYATLLRDAGHEVTVYTSTARDSGTWENYYPSGPAQEDGISVIRFPTEGTRGDYWRSLDKKLHKYQARMEGPSGYAAGWEWIRAQGPYCPGLVDALKQAKADRFLYMTYLYYPVLAGAQVTPVQKNYLVPTLHYERPARFYAIRSQVRRFRNLIWNTLEEGELAAQIWNVKGGVVVGAPVASPEERPEADRLHSEESGSLDFARNAGAKPNDPPSATQGGGDKVSELLYIGRWDGGKGTDFLLSQLSQLRQLFDFKFTIIGSGSVGDLPDFARHLGFVDEEMKRDLLRRCSGLIVPSMLESFSIVTLEAMSMGCPVLLNGNNPVLAGHSHRSGCGLLYYDAPSFLDGASRLLCATFDQKSLEQGRAYVSKNYSKSAVATRLLQALELN